MSSSSSSILSKTVSTAVTLLLVTAIWQLFSSLNLEEHEHPTTTTTSIDISTTTTESTCIHTCKTKDCKQIAKYIKDAISHGIDPCDNFFEFACHGWLEQHPRPPDASFWDVLYDLEMKTDNDVLEMLKEPSKEDSPQTYLLAKDFFGKCVDQDSLEGLGIQPILDILQEYGGWPLLKIIGTWDSSNFNWIKSLTDLHKRFSMKIFLDIESMQVQENNRENGTSFIIVDTPPEEIPQENDGLQDPKLYKPGTKEYNALKNFIVTVAKAFMDTDEDRRIETENLDKQADELIDLGSKILNLGISSEDADESEYGKIYGFDGNSALLKLEQIQEMIDEDLKQKFSENTNELKIKLNFTNLINNLYENTGFNVTNEQMFYILNVNYLLGLSRILSETSQETLANYLHFQMVYKLVPMTTLRMREYFEELKRHVDGVIRLPGKEQVCTELVQNMFYHAVGYEYVKRMGKRENKIENFENVKIIYGNLKSAITETINESKVISNKMALKSRLNKTELCVGYPKWYDDGDANRLALEYKNLNISEPSTFVQEFLQFNTWIANKNLAVLGEPLDTKCFWPAFAGLPAAYSDSYRHKTLMPLGLIQDPIYNPNRPSSLNYGAIGSILAHHETRELLGKGWTEENDKKFGPISQCLIAQYNNFSVVEIPDTAVNGKNTLMENIVDNAALLATYKAYKNAESLAEMKPNWNEKLSELEDISGDQLFFLGFAMSWCESHSVETLRKEMEVIHGHSPTRFRVLGSLQNSKEFANAWNCPIGSNMNKRVDNKKCRVL